MIIKLSNTGISVPKYKITGEISGIKDTYGIIFNDTTFITFDNEFKFVHYLNALIDDVKDHFWYDDENHMNKSYTIYFTLHYDIEQYEILNDGRVRNFELSELYTIDKIQAAS